MGYDIVHVLEEGWPNGCCSQIEHFNIALDKYHTDHNHHIFLIKDKRDKLFNLKAQHVPLPKIIDTIRQFDKPVVLLHRILRSNSFKYSSKLYKKNKFPFFIVNHTFHPRPGPIGRCDGIICVSEHMRNYYREKFKDFRCYFIRNGVNQHLFDNIKPNPTFHPNKDVFRAGRIAALNGYKYNKSFHEWISIEKFPKQLYYQYIGEGVNHSDAVRNRKTIKKKNNKVLNSVEINGPVYNHKKKIGMLKGWDLFIYDVNRHEGSSMSVLESLACGVPVICSNHYGTIEMIEDGVNGYVYKKLDPYCRRIVRNLMNDPDALKELKRSTYEHFSKNLDAKYMVRSYLNLFDKVNRKMFRKKNR